MMSEPKLCEACGASSDRLRPLNGHGNKDVAGALCCPNCRGFRPSEAVYEDVRNRRRSRPAAEPVWHEVSHAVLEVGDHVRVSSELKCYGEGIVQRLANERGELLIGGMPGRSVPQEIRSYWKFELRDTPAPQADSGFKVGDRVRIKRGEETATILAIDSVNVADLLYDDGEKMCCPLENLEPPPPSEDPKRQPEANPLRHLAEAFRELCECFCADCETICPPGRMVPMDELCVYCFHREQCLTGNGDMSLICEWREGIDRMATPKEAERHPADWDVEDVGYLP